MRKSFLNYSKLSLSVLLTMQPLLTTVVSATELDEGEPAITALQEEIPIATIPENSNWQGSVFGDVGGQSNITRDNFEITEFEDGTVKMISANNRGKISGSTDGIAYYFQSIPENANFEFSVTVDVIHFEPNNQVGFGIMLRNDVPQYVNGSDFAKGDHLTVGALDQTMKAFSRYDGAQKKYSTYGGDIVPPTQLGTYEISVKKMGNLFVTKVNDEVQYIEDYAGVITYAGLFTSRNTEVLYRDLQLVIEEETDRELVDLEVLTQNAKTNYLVDEPFVSDGFEIIAHYSDGTKEMVPAGEYVVTGFDSSMVGINDVKFYYGNLVTTIPLTISALTVTDMRIVYYPAKTNYYIGDSFVADGLVIEADYNNGNTDRLSSELYEIQVPEVFHTPGEQEVVIVSTQTPEKQVSFMVTIEEAELDELIISQTPQKDLYFLGEELNLNGLVVYATYADGSRIRLDRSEYQVSELDTTTPGIKTLVVTHKGENASFDVEVKEKEMVGIAIAEYPKTTYTVGELFDASGLLVVQEYDNGDTVLLAEEEYEVLVPNFEEARTYQVIIRPVNPAFSEVLLPITVVEAEEVEWHTIRFGQSTSDGRNYFEIHEDGSITLTALEGGGKVTGDHDGITFYYTVIDALEDNFELSATVHVQEYAKNPHDGQESFGIMARDAIGTSGDSSVFASNIAAIGGYSGGTRDPNGIQLFARTGVESSDGAGSQGIQSMMLDEHRPLGEYHLTLKKTNSGYVGSVNGGKEATIFEPDILNVQNSKIYVGFYTARLATIDVSDIDFTITKAATDAPKVEPPKEAVEPSVSITSLARTSEGAYPLRLLANVNGTFMIKQGFDTIETEVPAYAGKEVVIPAQLQGDFTNFSVTFIPEDTQYLTSYDRIVQNFTVEQRVYEGDIIVSPEGTPQGEGTIESPLDVDTAIDFVLPGQKIILQDGVYLRNSRLEIKKHNNGTAVNRKYLVAAEGATPIFDFDERSEGGVLSGNYWHISGIDFTRSAGNTRGFTVGGSYNIIENSRFYRNGDTGLQISRTDRSDNIEDWPSYNLMKNVTSFDNRDPSNNNADGFAAKLTSGEGNVFDGAIAFNNIDDGWDLYTKVGSGKIGAVTIRNSIAFNNGFVSYHDEHRGDGNGFKLGGEGVHVPHVIENSIAFGNLTYGFTSNSNPGVIARNNLGFNNGSGNLSFTTYNHIPTDFTIDGFVSYHKAASLLRNAGFARDQYPAELEAVNNFFYDGTESRNIDGLVLTDENFRSLEYAEFLRDENGDIIWGDFLAFITPLEEEPVDPEEPGETEEPGDAETPEEPGDTDQPGDEEEPSETEEPGESGEPSVPGEPTEPDQSGGTEEPSDTTNDEDDAATDEETLPASGLAQNFASVIGIGLIAAGMLLFISIKKRKHV